MSNHDKADPQKTNPSTAPTLSASQSTDNQPNRQPHRLAVLFQTLLLALLFVAGLLVVLLLTDGFNGLFEPFADQEATQREMILQNEEPSLTFGGAPDTRASDDIAPINAVPNATITVDDQFRTFYDAYGGVQFLGLPISGVMEVNGRNIQWFERARLEHWPEYAGTPYEIQLGRVGSEYTQSRDFPQQTFFPGQPGLHYFAETNHGVSDRFLAFWEQYGGLDIFGYPISDEFDERLNDGNIYRVQYFERARLEYHPELAGTPYEIQSGLLGQALYLNERRPDTIPPPATAVPLP